MPVSSSNTPLGTNALLFKLAGANMQLTTDQVFAKLFGGSAYLITAIIARQRSGGASVACLGGVYDGAGKTGNIIIAATQSWVTLASGIIVSGALAALTTTSLLTAAPILSLTTGSTAACTADVYVFGYDIS